MPVLSRVEARRQLGIPEKDVVLLTIASGYKYTPLGEMDFEAVLAPVLRQHKNALLLVVGPNINSYWQEASRQAGGRIRLEGPQENVAVFYQAADIYLDSFPCGSLTSMIEAGSYGLPLISYCPHREIAPVICSDDVGLDANLIRETNLQDYQYTLSRLISDSDLRAQIGQKLKKTIEAEHMEEDWRIRLSAIYQGASQESMDSNPPCDIDRKFREPLDAWLAALHVEAGICRDVDSLFLEHVGLLPFWSRLRIVGKTLIERRRIFPRLLLSDYTRARIRMSMKF
jgi:hypothetical protein